MPSIREIKRRKQSIQSTGQITKAMKLASTAKLQKAKEIAKAYEPYTKYLHEMVDSILESSEDLNSSKKVMLVISSNRGLAGGFHSNLLKAVLNSRIPKEELLLYTAGEKVRDGLVRNGYQISKDYSMFMADAAEKTSALIGREILKLYEDGEIGEIYLAYTRFENTVTQIPVIQKLLPADKKNGTEKTNRLMNYEPDEETVLDKVLPLYLYSLIYGAFLESAASEYGARMQAMDAASKNAADMLEELSLQYNRLRQGNITRELTEIIAGAQALE